MKNDDSPKILFQGYNEALQDIVVGSYLYQPIYDTSTEKHYSHWIVRDDGFKYPVLKPTVKRFYKRNMKKEFYPEYKEMLRRINTVIHVKNINKIQMADSLQKNPSSLYKILTGYESPRTYTMDDILYYLNLEYKVDGISGKYYEDVVSYINETIIKRKISKKSLQGKAGIGVDSLRSFLEGKSVSMSVMISVLRALGMDIEVI